MADALPGTRLRPHVKAHKCTALAARQAQLGNRSFTCATIGEIEGMARAGLGDDLLLANEVVDATRLGAVVRGGSRVTMAVDSEAIIAAAVGAGVPEVLIDVNVGLPRCGCRPEDAGRLAESARRQGLVVRGVMGYEGISSVWKNGRRAWNCSRARWGFSCRLMQMSAATSSQPAARAPTTSIAGPTRFKRARMPSWIPPTASSVFLSARRFR
jgi:D-serine deaminase-like pyridoxal phosphate-dependent protein